MVKDEAAVALSDMLSRLPEWVRTDLAAKDPSNRTRAEETLLAMTIAVLFGEDSKQAA